MRTIESYLRELNREHTSIEVGTKFEKKVKRYLINKLGFRNIKHGKKGQCDWIGINKKGEKVFVECKKSKHLKPSSWSQAQFLEAKEIW